MTDVTDETAAVPPRVEPLIGRGACSWPEKATRGLVLAALSLVGGTVAVVGFHQPHLATPRYRAVDATPTVSQTTDDPIMAELIRCRSLPPQATDPNCDRAWEENRRRFFGETRESQEPGENQPGYAAIPAQAHMPRAAQPASSAAEGD